MPAPSERQLRFMNRRAKRGVPDNHGDPTEAMSNLFDIALLIGIGFLIVALSGMGLKDLLSKDDITIVKNPGKVDMEIITRQAGSIKRLKATGNTVGGVGKRIGSVYRLEDGQVVWLPENEQAVGATSTP